MENLEKVLEDLTVEQLEATLEKKRAIVAEVLEDLTVEQLESALEKKRAIVAEESNTVASNETVQSEQLDPNRPIGDTICFEGGRPVGGYSDFSGYFGVCIPAIFVFLIAVVVYLLAPFFM